MPAHQIVARGPIESAATELAVDPATDTADTTTPSHRAETKSSHTVGIVRETALAARPLPVAHWAVSYAQEPVEPCDERRTHGPDPIQDPVAVQRCVPAQPPQDERDTRE